MKVEKGLVVTKVYGFSQEKSLQLPLYLTRISAGFPSPAEDYIDKKLDLNEFLVRHPAATFFVRVEGESMVEENIKSGDILIVDRSLEAKDGSIVIAALNGELTVKRIHKAAGKLSLLAANPAFKPIEITPEMNFEIWGVVTYTIHKFRI